MLVVAALATSDAASSEGRAKHCQSIILRIAAALAALYSFMLGLDMMGSAFLVLGGKGAGELFASTSNPASGLVVGVMATVLVQSSSTSTSIVVGLVSAGQLSVPRAIPVIMGANIGTSITNTIVSMAHATSHTELEYAFAGATVHDIFNLLTVLVLLPTEAVVAAVTGEGGPLFYISRAITKALMSGEGNDLTFVSPTKSIVSPLTDFMLDPNKDVMKALSLGAPVPAAVPSSVSTSSCPASLNCSKYFCVTSAMWNAWEKIDQDGLASLSPCGSYLAFADGCQAKDGQGGHCYLGADKFYAISIEGGRLLKSGMLSRVGEIPGGIMGLVLSFALITGSLLCFVRVLQSLLVGQAQQLFQRATRMNDCMALFLGFAVTFVVQSSSVTTSTLIPLCAIGSLPVHKMLMITLGANVGTTFTSLFAALAVLKPGSLQIALCHLVFNIIGILIWFPAPLRRVPVNAACVLGFYASCWRLVPFIYIVFTFGAAPVACLSISLLYSATVAGGIVVTCLGVVMLVVFAVWWQMGGCYRVVSKEVRLERAARKARELELTTPTPKAEQSMKYAQAKPVQRAVLRNIAVDTCTEPCEVCPRVESGEGPETCASPRPLSYASMTNWDLSKEATEAAVPEEHDWLQHFPSSSLEDAEPEQHTFPT